MENTVDNKQNIEVMVGEKPHQFKQFMTYLELRKFEKDKFQVSEREYFTLMKKFNWKLRAKKIDNVNSAELVEEHREQLVDLKKIEFENFKEIYEALQINMSIFLKSNEATPDYFKVSDEFSFEEVTKRMMKFQRIIKEYIRQTEYLSEYFHNCGIEEFEKKDGKNNDLISISNEMKSFSKFDNKGKESLKINEIGENDGLDYLLNSPMTKMNEPQKKMFKQTMHKIGKENNLNVNTKSGCEQAMKIFAKKVG